MLKVFVKTLGCKVNTFDSLALETQFKEKGYELAASNEGADITVLNTCSVTSNAEKEARYLLRKFQRENPTSLRVVTGCYAQINSAKIAALPEVDLVVPNEAKERLLTVVEDKLKGNSQAFDPNCAKLPKGVSAVTDNKQGHFKSSLTFFDHPNASQTRAFLKIQDGCNGFCSYCQIPYARGASRSVPPAQVVEQVRRLVSEGVVEIVLTGIHIGDYGEEEEGLKEGKLPFIHLLEEIFHVPGLKRLRISSLEPSELSTPLLEVLAAHRDIFCEHFHLPLQSGSARILKLMNRKYTPEEYFAKVQEIKIFFPNAQVSADILPGFPGETEQDFQDSCDFVKACGLHALHVFPFSKRPNTRAIRMPDHLPQEVVKERARILREMSDVLWKEFSRRFLSEKASILWENNEDASGKIQGKTKNYLQVIAHKEPWIFPGQETEVFLKGFVDKQTILGSHTNNETIL